MDMAMPYLIQFVREYAGKVDKLILQDEESRQSAEAVAKEAKEAQHQQNMYATLMPPALPAPGDFAPGGGYAQGFDPATAYANTGYIPQQQQGGYPQNGGYAGY